MRQTERGGTERTGQLGAFLLALALLLVLTVFAHRVVLGLAAVIAGPLPAARTALSLSRKAMQETVPDETPGSIASEPAPESAPEAAAPAKTGMESYLAALEADDARPADAGAVQERLTRTAAAKNISPAAEAVSKTTPVSRRQKWRRKSQTLCPLR